VCEQRRQKSDAKHHGAGLADMRLYCRRDQEEESLMEVTRRNLIQILSAAAPAAAAQTQEHAHPSSAPTPQKPAYQRKLFDEHQWKTVGVLCDLILPADERSGSATAAGVPEFIDDWIDFRRREDGNDALASLIQGGLSWLDAESRRLFQKDFAMASETQQKQI